MSGKVSVLGQHHRFNFPDPQLCLFCWRMARQASALLVPPLPSHSSTSLGVSLGFPYIFCSFHSGESQLLLHTESRPPRGASGLFLSPVPFCRRFLVVSADSQVCQPRVCAPGLLWPLGSGAPPQICGEDRAMGQPLTWFWLSRP